MLLTKVMHRNEMKGKDIEIRYEMYLCEIDTCMCACARIQLKEEDEKERERRRSSKDEDII